MKLNLFLRIFLAGIFLSGTLIKADEKRIWTSSVGSKITAVLRSFDGTTVILSTEKGKTLRLSLQKLSEEDQAFLLQNHAPSLPEPQDSIPLSDTPLPIGEISGPIDTPSGKQYFIYLPKTLVANQKAPVLVWTDAARSNANMLKRFLKIADLTGVVIATPQGKLQNPNNWFEKKHRHTKACLDHISETLSFVNTSRVIFSGGSGGGKVAWINSSKLPCIGVMPFIATIPDGTRPPKDKFYYVGTGASDYFRYNSARDAKKFRDRAIHRLYPGGHTLGERYWAEDGLLWIYSRHIYESAAQYSKEIANFEPRLLNYLETLASQRPHEAYYWTDFYLNQCSVSTHLKPSIEKLHRGLGETPDHQRYLRGRKELTNFSRDQLSSITPSNIRGHVTSKLEKYSDQMKQEYLDLPHLPEIFKGLGQKTN